MSVHQFVLGLLALYLACVLFVHFRGRERLRFKRQLLDHSGFFAPYNVLLYLFSALPARPYPERSAFAYMDPVRAQWQTIRKEAMRLFDEGYIRAAEKNNDASFASFFRTGWKRFYLKWYDLPPQSARVLCPQTVALVESVPQIKAAMFALLPAGAKLNPHRDPFAGSLRYHLGLSTPNSDACHIFVDGQSYAWRDGEDVIFDETYVHWVENDTDTTRVILFCDLERPLRTRLMRAINSWISGVLGRATATQNMGGERVGTVNRMYAGAERMGELRKRFKRALPWTYQISRATLALALLAWLLSPWWRPLL